MHFPKVLIVGQPFNNNSGGGITQSNLFTDWDKEKIAVVCTMHMFNNLNTDICNTYYLLGSEEYKWIFPFSMIQRHAVSGVRKIEKSFNKSEQEIPVTPTLRAKLIDNYFYPFLEFAGLMHCISRIELSDQLKRWLNEYKPDIIYAQASSRETVLFCTMMQSYTGKPMVFHMMDDWPSTISEKGIFKNVWKRRIDREFRSLLGHCELLLSISRDMAEEYRARYNREFITFHNPIDLNFWKSGQKKECRLSDHPYVLYAGRIGPGIRDCLEMMAKALEHYNRDARITIRFILQTKEKPEWVDQYSCVQHKHLVPYTDLPSIFGEADFLYLPYDFSEDAIRFIKFSMPTKAPEYMISGTPVIILAPAETTLVKDAIRGNWAKVVTDYDVNTLAEAIKELAGNLELRRQLSGNAINIAEHNYNAIKIREQFRKVTYSLAGSTRLGEAILNS